MPDGLSSTMMVQKTPVGPKKSQAQHTANLTRKDSGRETCLPVHSTRIGEAKSTKEFQVEYFTNLANISAGPATRTRHRNVPQSSFYCQQRDWASKVGSVFGGF